MSNIFVTPGMLRNQEQRIGKIIQSDVDRQIVVMEDRFVGQFYASMHLHDSIAVMPAVGEVWMVKRVGIDWVLDKRVEDGTESIPFADLQPGDRRIYSPGTTYISGDNGITMSGTLNVHSDTSFSGPVTFNVPINSTSISGSDIDHQVLTSIGGQSQWASIVQAVTTALVPVGSVMQYAGSGTSPDGWLICSGTAISRTGYVNLFSTIGTTYGSGDGSTTFNLPDFRGRVPVGRGPNASVSTVGNNEGVAAANRRPQHQHTPHSHTWQVYQNTGDSPGGTAGNWGGATWPTSSVDGGSGISTDSLDAPAYLVVNYIIKY